jgi:eukaryotic-like serine/threonine-protein kinase
VRAELDAFFPPPEKATPPPDGPDLPPVPGYEVEAVLGRGGMGIVFRASHVRLKGRVALKMLLAGAYASPHERALFQREAEGVPVTPAKLTGTPLVSSHVVMEVMVAKQVALDT